MLIQKVEGRGLMNTIQEMDLLGARLRNLLSAQQSAGEFPLVNVYFSDDGALLESELPGLEPDDLEISVSNEILTLKGARQEESLSQDERFHRRERVFGQFSRSIKLPFPVDSERVTAKLNNGVLRLQLPRQAADMPRRISVKSGS